MARIQVLMNWDDAFDARKLSSAARTASFAGAMLLCGGLVVAQESSQAPLTPPPETHDVRRMSNVPEAPAPPALPPEEIIQKFAEKEDKYLAVRAGYGARRTIRIDEFDHQGRLVGQFLSISEAVRGSNGQVFYKTVQHPQSTLHLVPLDPEDVKELDRVPPFPLTTGQLAKYDLKYIGDEQVDEINCYIFQVKPKGVDRAHNYFDGIVWVDQQYLEVVKTYGKWVNELGDVKVANMPFTMFETYRENVDGKYWFPNYERSDDAVHLKDGDFPVRLVIKWTDFKPLPAAGAAAATTAPGPPPPADSQPSAPAKP